MAQVDAKGEVLTFGVVHLFGGSGGGAQGFAKAREKWQGISGHFVNLGGVDVDPEACVDFEALTGVPELCMDLFSREDYTAWHGHEPPEDWHEATPEDIRAASQGIRPDVVFTSPPCKGLSGLLPTAQANSAKYQALNKLTIRGIALALEAWRDDLPALIILENVPRIKSRGAHLLAAIKTLLQSYGYRVRDGLHDMGEVGGLAQHRRRYLLVARLPARMSSFLYQPPIKKVRAIGDELGRLPLPDDPAAGPMHHLPKLNWLTWLRLALIPAGQDWRALQDIAPGSFGIEGYGSVPHFNHVLRVTKWDDPSGTVAGGSRPAQGAICVADPRIPAEAAQYGNTYRVNPWDEAAGTVTAQGSPSNGAECVADPRLGADAFGHALRVAGWGDAAGTVTAARSPAYGAIAAADPRLPGAHWSGHFRVVRFSEPARTVTGQSGSFSSNAGMAVADPRIGYEPRKGSFRVNPWGQPSTTVIGATDVRGSNGVAAVADPRVSEHGKAFKGSPGLFGVIDWTSAAPAVTGSASVSGSNMAAAVADPRVPERASRRSGQLSVRGWGDAAMTVTGEDSVGSGAQCVADPRLPEARTRYSNKYAVGDWGDPAHTVTGMTDIQEGAPCVADPRLGCSPHNGAFRVLGWGETASTVTAAGDVHAQGAAIVADPRMDEGELFVADLRIPNPSESGVWVIVSEDGTWHRPLTTLELAILQGYPAVMPDGRLLTLAGRSQSRWRERIGNSVPVPAAQAIAETMLLALIPATLGAWAMSVWGTAVWVRTVQSLAERIDRLGRLRLRRWHQAELTAREEN